MGNGTLSTDDLIVIDNGKYFHVTLYTVREYLCQSFIFPPKRHLHFSKVWCGIDSNQWYNNPWALRQLGRGGGCLFLAGGGGACSGGVYPCMFSKCTCLYPSSGALAEHIIMIMWYRDISPPNGPPRFLCVSSSGYCWIECFQRDQGNFPYPGFLPIGSMI